MRVNFSKGEGGLEDESAIMIDQVRAIDNRRLLKKIGDLPSPLQKVVKENLKIVMDI